MLDGKIEKRLRKIGAHKEIDRAFWKKHEIIMNREKRLVGGKNFRVSEFKK